MSSTVARGRNLIPAHEARLSSTHLQIESGVMQGDPNVLLHTSSIPTTRIRHSVRMSLGVRPGASPKF